MLHREVKFIFDQVSEVGEFVGNAAVFGNVDQGNDIIDHGAFAKTIQDNGGIVPLLLDHRIPIGISRVEETEFGLKTHGILNLDKSVAKETHSDLKFYASHGRPYGMSFGYDAVKHEPEGKLRRLKELRLYETSVTLFPMNQKAAVGAVKSFEEIEGLIEEMKAGRVLSAATLRRMKEILDEHSIIMDKFQALMAVAENGDGKSTLEEESKAAPQPDEPPLQDSSKPADAPLAGVIDEFKNQLLGVLQWNSPLK